MQTFFFTCSFFTFFLGTRCLISVARQWFDQKRKKTLAEIDFCRTDLYCDQKWMARRKFLVWKGFDILGAVEKNQCFFFSRMKRSMFFRWSRIRIKWSGKWSHGRASLIQLIYTVETALLLLGLSCCWFWEFEDGSDSVIIARFWCQEWHPLLPGTNQAHAFSSLMSSCCLSPLLKLMVCIVLFLLFCGFFGMTTHKIEVQVRSVWS